MSGKRTVNLEHDHVVQEKSRVVLKALAELISTKYKVAVKSTEKEEVLDKMCDVIANKGRQVSNRSIPRPPKSEIIRRVRLISHLQGEGRTQQKRKLEESPS